MPIASENAISALQEMPCKIGARALRRAVGNGTAVQVFLALDADPAVTEPLAALCSDSFVPYCWAPAMAELGRICGIAVGAAAVTVVRA